MSILTRPQSLDEVLESFDGSVTPKIFMSSQTILTLATWIFLANVG